MPSTRTSRGSLAKRSWTRLSDEQLLGLRFCDLKLKIERSPVAKRVRRLYTRARQAADFLSSACVALGRMVFSRWCARHRGAVLPRASAPRTARAPHDAQRRRRQRRKRHAHPAPRSGPCHRHRVPAAPPQALARNFRPGVAAVSRYLSRASRQPPLRAAPGRVVRAGASLRRLCRDLRRLAQAQLLVAPHVRAVAGVPQARVRRRIAGERARHARRRCAIAKSSSRCARTRTRSPITIAASCAATACTGARSPITCSSACSPPSGMRRARARQHFPARAQPAPGERHDARAATPSVTAWSRSCASSSSAPRSCGVWVRGSRRDALRHARWMLVYLTRLYAQGESPRLSL